MNHFSKQRIFCAVKDVYCTKFCLCVQTKIEKWILNTISFMSHVRIALQHTFHQPNLLYIIPVYYFGQCHSLAPILPCNQKLPSCNKYPRGCPKIHFIADSGNWPLRYGGGVINNLLRIMKWKLTAFSFIFCEVSMLPRQFQIERERNSLRSCSSCSQLKLYINSNEKLTRQVNTSYLCPLTHSPPKTPYVTV